MIVSGNWEGIQREFLEQVGPERKDLLENLRDMDLPCIDKYAPVMNVERKVSYNIVIREFVIALKLNNAVGAKIQITCVKNQLFVNVGSIYSYRNNMEFFSNLGNPVVFRCQTSSKLEDLEFYSKPEGKYTRFTDFIKFLTKKLAFAYVIYGMCKSNNETSTSNEWTDNVVVERNDFERTEIRVGLNNATGFTKNNCYIKALFSIDNEDILVKIQCCEFYTAMPSRDTKKFPEENMRNINDLSVCLRKKKTLQSLLDLEQRIDYHLSFC